MSVSRAPEPPFTRLFTLDAAGLIGLALGVALITALAAVPGLARLWVSDHFGELSRDIQITATVAEGVSPESVLDALGARLPLADVRPIEEDALRARLAAAGVGADELDPFVFDALPRGFSFRVEGLFTPVHRPWPQPPLFQTLPRLRSTLTAAETTGDVEFHWDVGRATAIHSRAVRARRLMTQLHWAACALAAMALAALTIAHGRARLGVSLPSAQMAQALMIRSLVAAVLGYLLAGALIASTAMLIGDLRFAGVWESLMWIVAAAVLLAPLGVLRR